MKLIFKIAKAELRYLFYSPIAWFVIIAFLVMCGFAYTNVIPGIAFSQEYALANKPGFKDWGKPLTALLLNLKGGVFEIVIKYLYLFLPLLCMGLISRESNNGTSKLLYSSPIRLRQIVLGKYLGMMIYNLMLVLVISIVFVSIAFNVKSADTGLLFAAALGFYLITCTYAAIGMFMSSLTNYQIVSGISIFLVLALLNIVGGFFQRFDFVRDLTYFLALPGRVENMLNGLITTRDLFYFLIVISMFISFTIIRLRAGRETKHWFVPLRRYVAVLVCALTVGYISSRPALIGYLDTTATQSNTLPKEIQQLIKNFGDDSLEVTLYTNLLGAGISYGLPEARNYYLANPWERYVRFKPDIRFNYEFYYDTDSRHVDTSVQLKERFNRELKVQAEVLAQEVYDINLNKFKSPAEMRNQINLQPENYRLVMQLKYKGRTTFLRTFDDPEFWPADPQISAALKRLQQDQIPKIYFVSGNLQRNIMKNGEREYSAHSIHKGVRSSLVNNGFDCDTISLDNSEIPSDATALVLADPKTTLSTITQNRLRQYIEKGGNLMIFGEPGKQGIVNPLLQQLDLRLMDGQLVQPTYNHTPDRVIPYAKESIGILSEKVSAVVKESQGRRPEIESLMIGVAAVGQSGSTAGFKTATLLVADSGRSWLKTGTLVKDSAAVVFNAKGGDSSGAFTTAIGLMRNINGKEQRIAVTGDADFAGNLRLGKNAGVVEALYSWMNNGVFPVYTAIPKPKDVLLTISSDAANAMNLIYVWILPALLTGIAAILLIRRKRK